MQQVNLTYTSAMNSEQLFSLSDPTITLTSLHLFTIKTYIALWVSLVLHKRQKALHLSTIKTYRARWVGLVLHKRQKAEKPSCLHSCVTPDRLHLSTLTTRNITILQVHAQDRQLCILCSFLSSRCLFTYTLNYTQSV